MLQDAYLFKYGTENTALHETRASIFLDKFVCRFETLTRVGGAGSRIEVGLLLYDIRRGMRRLARGGRGRATSGILLQELLTASEALLEILIRPPTLSSWCWGAWSTSDAGLQSREHLNKYTYTTKGDARSKGE